MATAKKSAPSKKAAKTIAPAAKKAATKSATASAGAAMKPIKTAFNKTSLIAHLATQTSVEPKAVKAVMAALESAMFASLHKKGMGEFTLPGLLKITAMNVPAKKKRFGKDPFTGAERWFAPKPASTKVKLRAMKRLKDAAV